MKISTIIFDLDGTLADTIPLTVHSIRETARKLSGREYSDEEILKAFGPIDTEIIKGFVEEDKRDTCADEYIKHFDENFDAHVKPIDGIRELLAFIKESGIKTGLFTGRSLRGTRIVLRHLGIDEHIDVLIPGDDTTYPKPDPEGIWKAMDRLQAQQSETIYVGDFDVDIQASKAAGVISVLALWSSTGSERLIEHKPDHYFKTPYEFINWLKTEKNGGGDEA